MTLEQERHRAVLRMTDRLISSYLATGGHGEKDLLRALSVPSDVLAAIGGVVVPWCTKHDEAAVVDDVACDWGHYHDTSPCQLEEPARHYLIKEQP